MTGQSVHCMEASRENAACGHCMWMRVGDECMCALHVDASEKSTLCALLHVHVCAWQTLLDCRQQHLLLHHISHFILDSDADLSE